MIGIVTFAAFPIVGKERLVHVAHLRLPETTYKVIEGPAICRVTKFRLNDFTPEVKTRYIASSCNGGDSDSVALPEIEAEDRSGPVELSDDVGPECSDQHVFFLVEQGDDRPSAVAISTTLSDSQEASPNTGVSVRIFLISSNDDGESGKTNPYFSEKRSFKLLGHVCSDQQIEEATVKKLNE